MEERESEKSPPREVDLGGSLQNAKIVNRKPQVGCENEDDDVALLVLNRQEKKKKKKVDFLKLIAVTIFVVSLLLVISSCALTYKRRALGGGEFESTRMLHNKIEPSGARVIVATNNDGGFPVFTSFEQGFVPDYVGLNDNCFNHYLTSLHHLRNDFLSGLASMHSPSDFIKVRFGTGIDIGEDLDDDIMASFNGAQAMMADFCSDLGNVFCRVLLDTGNSHLVILRSVPEEMPSLQDAFSGPYFLPLKRTDGFSKEAVKPTLIPVVHSEKAAAAVEKKKNIKPEVIPHYCPRLSKAPEKITTSGLFILFPGKTLEFTNQFMTNADQASDNLGIAGSLFHITSMEKNQVSPQNVSKSMKAIIFPMRNVPEETLHLFQCLGIPMFVPLIDFAEVWASGDAAMKCNDTDVLGEEILHHTFYSGFSNVIHYSCFYELVEKLNQVDLDEVRDTMWQENVEKNKEAQAKLENLHKKAPLIQN